MPVFLTVAALAQLAWVALCGSRLFRGLLNVSCSAALVWFVGGVVLATVFAEFLVGDAVVSFHAAAAVGGALLRVLTDGCHGLHRLLGGRRKRERGRETESGERMRER